MFHAKMFHGNLYSLHTHGHYRQYAYTIIIILIELYTYTYIHTAHRYGQRLGIMGTVHNTPIAHTMPI